jgi:carboxyl-terminal processing protease
VVAITLGAAFRLQTPSHLRGVWQTDGYGRVVEIGRYRIAVYDITTSTCALSFQTRANALFLAQWHLTVADDRQSMQFRDRQDPHLIRADRITQVPQTCLSDVAVTPEQVFAAFTESMASHYAFFDLYDVNWADRIAKASRQIAPDITEDQLFQVMATLLDGIADGHVYLRGDPDGVDQVALPGRNLIASRVLEQRQTGQLPEDFRFLQTYWDQWVLQDILQGRGIQGANGQIAWGVIGAGTGYIALRRLQGFADADHRAMAALDEAMENALQDFAYAGTTAIILDLSANPGGSDHFARAVAGRFTDAPFFAYQKHAADARATIHSKVTVTPADGTRFTGPVYLLTTQLTGSAAEILTIAMRQVPTVVHVGETTGGSLSDVLDRTLPNGWTHGISNEVYRDLQGQSWEGRGIPPDLPLRVFDLQNLSAGHSAAIHEIQRILQAQHTK